MLVLAPLLASFSGQGRSLSEEESSGGLFETFVNSWLHACTGECKTQTPAYASALMAMQTLFGTFPKAYYDDMKQKLDSVGMPKAPRQIHDRDRGCLDALSPTCFPSVYYLSSLLSRVASKGGLIVELNPFLGQASMGLATPPRVAGSSLHTVLAVDTWKGNTGIIGKWSIDHTYIRSTNAAAALKMDVPEMYLEYQRSVQSYDDDKKYRVVPLMLKDVDSVGRDAALLGALGWRPDIVWANAPRGPGFAKDLGAAYRLLACGGALAGDNYHIPRVHEPLMAFSAKHGLTPTAYAIHGVGTVWEKPMPYSEEKMVETVKSNYSIWEIVKECKGSS